MKGRMSSSLVPTSRRLGAKRTSVQELSKDQLGSQTLASFANSIQINTTDERVKSMLMISKNDKLYPQGNFFSKESFVKYQERLKQVGGAPQFGTIQSVNQISSVPSVQMS